MSFSLFPAPFFQRTRLFLLLFLTPAVALPQAAAKPAGSDYTAGLPTVQQVQAQMQGTDVADTTARQVAVLEYLVTYINDIRPNVSAPYSPAEVNAINAYRAASNQLRQDFGRAHTADDVKAFQQKVNVYEINNAMDWVRQLQGPQAAAQFKASLTPPPPAQQQTNLPSSGGGGLLSGLLAGGSGNNSLTDDQKRCLELGGSYDDCVNNLMDAALAFGKLLTSAIGVSPQSDPPVNGIVIVGKYHSTADLPELTFGSDGNATLSNCGPLVDAAHPYTIRKSGTNLQIVVSNEPNPITLSVNADNSLDGPGTIQVKGNVIIGHHIVTITKTGNCAPNCVSSTSTPIYQAKIDACTVRMLARQTPPPAIYVTGDYTSPAGLLLSFSNGYVTMDCGQAHVNAPYTVDNTTTGFVVHVQKTGGAFVLTTAPDNSLHGSGSTTVNGKLISAVNGSNVSFTAHSETCAVGSFTPKSTRNLVVASDGTNSVLVDPSSSSRPAPANLVAGDNPVTFTQANSAPVQ